MMYHNIMKRSLALKDSTNLWNQNSSVDIIKVKLCLRPQKQVLNPLIHIDFKIHKWFDKHMKPT
jgi:hypothetical protein